MSVRILLLNFCAAWRARYWSSILVLGLSACGSTQPVRHWHLSAESAPRPPVVSPAANAPACQLRLLPLSVPDYLRRSELVIHPAPAQIAFAGTEFWISPFPDTLQAGLLSQWRLEPNASARWRWADENDASAADALRLQVTLETVNNLLDAQGAQTQWQVSWRWQRVNAQQGDAPSQLPGRQPPGVAMTTAIQQRASGEPYAALVQATRQATRDLAQKILASLPFSTCR
ncbi:PqiC family protein [Parvibium lacunae]|uniref:ABC-type transport auxiliary lipoprotein component domain-containing protein n=1 Tax=Parvibium lacunae TaxID=1888893 RepID=A0A368KYR6_9BURK|nr:ABC-type transport auxiliary lipoprotein family protein [Parvibium lacunae]RCS56555.1 hypothetical protein DU000_11350 [Parvibium lacunae]